MRKKLYLDLFVTLGNETKSLTFKWQPHKMIKHTQTIHLRIVLSVFDHFVQLALKGLNVE